MLAEAIEKTTIATEQLMSVYHGKGLSTISCFIMLTAVLTAEFSLNLADNGEFQRQRYNNKYNEGNLTSLVRSDYDYTVQIKKETASLAYTIPRHEGYTSPQHLNLSGNHCI